MNDPWYFISLARKPMNTPGKSLAAHIVGSTCSKCTSRNSFDSRTLGAPLPSYIYPSAWKWCFPKVFLAASSALCQQHRGGGDKLAVARGHATVGQDRRVLQTGADAVAARHGAAIDRPGGDAIAVVDLLESDSAFGQRPLDGLGVGDRVVGVGVQRLDHRPYAARRDPRRDEDTRVVER